MELLALTAWVLVAAASAAFLVVAGALYVETRALLVYWHGSRRRG